MSAEYAGQDPLEIAMQAERDLNSHQAKHGTDDPSKISRSGNDNAGTEKGPSTSVTESGVNANVERKFPGASVTYGSAASGAGDNREIPVEEGGDINPKTGQPTKARDFEGVGGPEDKAREYAEANPGNDDVRDNVRQGSETVRP